MRNLKSSNLKGDLDNIIMMALRKEPKRRYASVEEFSNDIDRYLKELPVKARPNTFLYRSQKLFQRNKIAFIATLIVILAVLAGLIVSLWQTQIARRQRDLAQVEKEKSERINKFLQQMLSFSNQSYTSISPVAQGKNVTVNEMLDQITPNIEKELADQPEVRAKILRTIGSSYASQGFYEKAEKNLRAALDIQLQVLGENSTETANTMIEIGVLNYRQSKFQDSLPLLEKAVDFYRKHQKDFPENSPAKLIQALNFLAANKYYSGDTALSVALCEEGLQIAQTSNLIDNEREVIAGLKVDFGLIIARLGDKQRGDALIREGIALYSEISNKPRWEVGNAKTSLSFVLLNQNKLDEALNVLIESEKIVRETLGDKNLYLASTLKGEANVYTQKNDFKSAEKAATESLKILQEILPPNSPFIAGPMVSLGIVLTKTGRLAEGEKNLRQALIIYEQQSKKNITLIAPCKIALTENLIAQNRFDDAEKIALEAFSEAQQTLGEQNALTVTAKKNLAKLYSLAGKKEMAQKYENK
ncbi:MAG: tetratricopeptide repeat protein [Pyrinomonadaceae bacterium]|nr:tetratricopeptide repeat protein [Pyrinomonadaceae bacterium]